MFINFTNVNESSITLDEITNALAFCHHFSRWDMDSLKTFFPRLK